MQTYRAAGIASAAALLFALTGCGGSDEHAGHDTPAASATGDKPSTPRKQLILSAAEFPAGTQFANLSSEQLSAGLTEASKALDNATFTPAECGQASKDSSGAVSNIAATATIAAAVDPKSNGTYSEFIGDTALDLNKIHAAATGNCANISAALSSQGQPITVKLRFEPSPVPDAVKSLNAAEYLETTEYVAPGKPPITKQALRGYAIVRGYTVGVLAQAGSAPLDRAAFNLLFLKAIQKVQNAK